MSLLDFLKDKSEEVLTANYYPALPRVPSLAQPMLFSYGIVNESDKSYAKLLDQLQTTMKTMTIHTDDDCGFKIDGYVATQDGSLWVIAGLVESLVNENTKQALRFMKKTIQTKYVLRLVGIDNPMGLK
jgi:hypothetical protein